MSKFVFFQYFFLSSAKYNINAFVNSKKDGQMMIVARIKVYTYAPDNDCSINF